MLVDVSQPVSSRSACFAGDQPFECNWSLKIAEKQSFSLSTIRTSPHVGTHVDAPSHTVLDGAAVDELALDIFFGPAVVIDARGHKALDVDLFEGLDLASHPRVLFRTQDAAPITHFLGNFPLLTPGAIDHMAGAGVRVVGVDVASVDDVASRELSIHKHLAARGIVNIENLRLDEAPMGACELIAPPVKWVGAEAAPLRAVLRVA